LPEKINSENLALTGDEIKPALSTEKGIPDRSD